MQVSPQSLSFDELVSRVSQRLAAQTVPGLPSAEPLADELARTLPAALLMCARGGFLDVDRHSPVITAKPSERPRASAVARARADGTAIIPTLLHGQVSTGAPERFLLARLDGTRTRADLLADLEAATARGDLAWDNPPPSSETAATAIDDILKFFATSALLEA
jgi:hypothetical protein